ncbi:MAG: dockerin type I repeat-containing protein [Clostridia bacterium]|nr:dockerin type I repeat-containing protein [Clostridia bacterium]
MKKAAAVIMALLLLLAVYPASAMQPAATVARTTLLDLSNAASASSSAAEGWAFDPTGYNGYPQLTLNSYGKANQHSAPIKLPPNCRVLVNGTNYIDNVYMGEEYHVLSGGQDGFLRIEGTGTLNLYANQYNGRCISMPLEGANVHVKFLYITGVTVNCYGLERDMYNASTLHACIYSGHSVEIHNAVINTIYGRYGIMTQGYTPIGGVSEETADVILIDSSTVNIQNYSDNGLWGHANGLRTTFGKIIITGNSNVTINAGSNSIYSYLSTTIDGGTVNILSTPLSTADSAAIVYCSRLVIGSNASRVYFSTTNYPLTKVLYCKEEYMSELGSGLNVEIGSFSSGNYATAPDPDNNNMPALLVTNSSAPVTYHTVRFFGLDGALIAQVSVPHGQAAQAPNVDAVVNNSDGTFVFYDWDADISCVTSDMDVHAEYVLLGDTDLNGQVTTADALLALRQSMTLVELAPKNVRAGDVTMDGVLTTSDALLILRYVMHLIPTLA